MPIKSKGRSLRAWVPILTVLLTLIPLTSGLFYGLPQQWDPDEYLFMRAAVRMVESGTLEPGWYGSPASTLFILLAGVIFVLQSMWELMGWVPSKQSFWDAYHGDVTTLYVAGRSVIVLAAVANIWLTDRILRCLQVDIVLRSFTVVLLAISPIYLAYATVIRVDFIQSGANLATILYCLHYFRGERPRFHIALAGVFLGIAVTSKYLGITAAIPIVAAVFMRARRDDSEIITGLSHLALAALISILTAFTICPFVFLDFGQTLADVAFEARSGHLSATSEGFISNVLFYLNKLASQFGWIGLFAIIGALSLVRTASGWIIISFGLAFLIFISALSLKWDRWLITLIPVVAIFISVGAHELLSRHSNKSWLSGATILFICAGLLTNVVNGTAHAIARLNNDDTRAKAEQWMRRNAAPGTSVLIETYGPALSSHEFRVTIARDKDLVPWTSQSPFDRPQGFFGFGLAGSFNGDAEDLLYTAREVGIEYVILTNWEERYRKEGSAALERVEFYDELKLGLWPVASFSANKTEFGPPITIYKRKN